MREVKESNGRCIHKANKPLLQSNAVTEQQPFDCKMPWKDKVPVIAKGGDWGSGGGGTSFQVVEFVIFQSLCCSLLLHTSSTGPAGRTRTGSMSTASRTRGRFSSFTSAGKQLQTSFCPHTDSTA